MNIPSEANPREYVKQVDLLDARIVEVEMDSTGKLWVNVDGVCRLRIGHVQNIKIELPDGLRHSLHKTT